MRSVWVVLMMIGCGDNHRPAEAPIAPDADAGPPTYDRDVAPILTQRCAGCHSDGGVGPFTLTSYEDAVGVSAMIVKATSDRVMPPWPADGACNTYEDARGASDEEIATLAAWHAAGTPEGNPADVRPVTPPAPTPFTATVELGSSAPYMVRPGPDEYRCFVVDPGIATDRYITAIAMRLDQATVVHHMQLFAADLPAHEQTISDREALDPDPGYACENDVGSGLRYVGVWAPGDIVRRWPDGTGIQLAAGHRLVVQLHYHNHGNQPVVDQTRVALELADAVDHVGWIDNIRGSPLYLPPHEPDVTIRSMQRLAIAQPGFLRAARIHMHGLGTRARMEVVRGGQSSCVLDIPRWDFNWQLFYRFTQPLAVDAGDQIYISCSYDTTSRDAPVIWGVGTEDEMCIGYSFLSE